MTPADPARKRRRRFLKVLGAGVLALAATVAALPWLASTTPARKRLLGLANTYLAPARVEASELEVSWLGPCRVSGFALRDRSGKAILAAPRISVDLGVLSLLASRPARGTVTLEGLAVDVERRPDGSIDLLDALATALGEGKRPDTNPAQQPEAPGPAPGPVGPGPDLTVKVVAGTLRLRSPELIGPFSARRMDATVHLPSGPGPATWQVALAGPAEGDDASLEISGEVDPRTPAADLSAKVSGKGWPLAVATPGIAARGRLEGTLAATRRGGLWAVSGNPGVLGLDAKGPVLAGDRLLLDRLGGTCDLAEKAGGWDIRTLDLASPIASLKAHGTVSDAASPGPATRVEGHLDLAALAGQLPHLLRLREGLALRSGAASVTLDIREGAEGEGQRLMLEARVSDLVALEGTREIAVREPATLSAELARQGGGLRVERLAVKTAFLDGSGSGDLERGIAISASIDLEGLRREFHDLIDFGGVELSGRGRIAADYRRAPGDAYAGRFAAEFRGLQVKGLTAEPIARDRLRLDAFAGGPATAPGWPGGWDRARLGAKTDDLVVEVRLAPGPSASALRIDEFHFGTSLPPSQVQPSGPAPLPDSFRFAARGQLDLAAGVLELRPLPGAVQPEPIALAAEGLSVSGLNASGETKVAAVLTGDLARLDRALAAWSGSAPREMAGTASLSCALVLKSRGELTVAGNVQAPDLSLPETGAPGRRVLGPIVLAIQAGRPAEADRLDVSAMTLACRYGTLEVSGSVAEPGGRRLADLGGKFTPNWPAIDALVAQSIEPAAKVRGEVRPFRWRGPLSGGETVAMLQSFDAEIGIDRFEALAFGARLEPTPIAVHWRGPGVLIEPIVSKINGGPTTLRPEIAFDGQKSMSLRLASGTAVEGAAINDDVSRGLLSYVAPMLRDASKVRGKVTMRVDRAEFPLLGDDRAQTTLQGQVEFDDVEFDGGPFADELVALLGKAGPTALTLNQPVQLSIADGRVVQQGLSVPIGREARLELSGSVGFDGTLAMVARMPVTGGMLGRQQGLEKLVEGLRVGIPIGGTLSRPSLDRRAFRLGLRDAGKATLKRNARRGAAELLERFVKPEDSAPSNPNDP